MAETGEIPDDIMRTAEKTLDLMLCNCTESTGDVRRASILDLANALLAERETAKAHWLSWHRKRINISTGFWIRAARSALDGDLSEIRNRVELHDAPPVDVVLSDAPQT